MFLDPETVTIATTVTRFWLNVDQSTDDECWLWTGYQEKGYGSFAWGGRMVGAHELALTFTTGERRQDGYDTRHLCHTPLCCNPAHLRFGTRAENVADSRNAGRLYKITDEQVREMRERAAAGASITRMADEYGVSKGQVSMICSGKRRRESPGPITTRPPGRPRKEGPNGSR